MNLSSEVQNTLTNRKAKGFSSNTCSTCSAGCCKQPGFAIFENTIEIYKKYISGSLARSDYVFNTGLSYHDFIRTYFDVVVYSEGDFHTFYPRIIINNDNLLSIPPFGSYYSNRDFFHANNPWLINYGCIFQERKRTSNGLLIKCILHNKIWKMK